MRRYICLVAIGIMIRYYDPQTGRFTQEDPLGLAGGMNAYGFGNGDPINYTDPFGLCPDPKNPACSADGLVFTFTVGGVAALGIGGNAQWGLAINSHADATLFQTHGKSIGIGIAAGPTVGVQRGSLNSLIAPSGQGGGRTVSVSAAPVGVSVSADDDNHLTGGGLGPKGPAAVTVNYTSPGKTIGTTNLRDDVVNAVRDIKRGVDEFVREGIRAMTYPGGLQP